MYITSTNVIIKYHAKLCVLNVHVQLNLKTCILLFSVDEWCTVACKTLV